MKIKKMELFALVTAALLASPCMADEEKRKVNHDAIPPVISPDDPDMKLSAEEHIKLLNARKADHVTRGMRVGGKLMANNT